MQGAGLAEAGRAGSASHRERFDRSESSTSTMKGSTMKTLHNVNDLTDYGLKPLTGEADAYSRRTLCDLSDEGVILLTAYFGLTHTTEACRAFPENWNSTVGDKPAVASVMLARGTMDDLMVFALLHVERCDYVMQTPGGQFSGFNEGDQYGENYLRCALPEGYHLHHNEAKRSHAPQVEGRNVHAMSGRVL